MTIQKLRCKVDEGRLIIILGGLICIAVALAIGLVAFSIFKAAEKEPKISDVVLEGEATLEELEQYIVEMDAKINNTTTNEEKARQYNIRAAHLSNYVEQYEDNSTLIEQIRSDVYKAEELSPSAETAMEIFYYENKYGAPEQAEHYHQLSKDRGWSDEFGDG